MMNEIELKQQQRKRRLVTILLISAFLMFSFAYALVPVYQKICLELGVNGKLMSKPVVYEAGKIPVDNSRTIRIRFYGDVKSNVPWQFYPEQKTLTVHPGELVNGKFFAKNIGKQTVTTRVVVNTIPAIAVKNVHEVVSCFCLQQHQLAPNEEKMMPADFYVDTNLPRDVKEVMIFYTLFNTKPEKAKFS